MAKINFEKPQDFIGIVIDKKMVTCKCIGFEDYKNKKGEDSIVLIWEKTSKISGQKEMQKTSFRCFCTSSLQNIENERNPTRVFWGKIGYAKRLEKNKCT